MRSSPQSLSIPAQYSHSIPQYSRAPEFSRRASAGAKPGLARPSGGIGDGSHGPLRQAIWYTVSFLFQLKQRLPDRRAHESDVFSPDPAGAVQLPVARPGRGAPPDPRPPADASHAAPDLPGG